MHLICRITETLPSCQARWTGLHVISWQIHLSFSFSNNGDRLAQHMFACLSASIHMTKTMWFNNHPQFNLLFQGKNTSKLPLLYPPFPINFLIFIVAPNFSVLINLPVSLSFNTFWIIPCSSNIFIPCSIPSITDFPLVLGQKKKLLKDWNRFYLPAQIKSLGMRTDLGSQGLNSLHFFLHPKQTFEGIRIHIHAFFFYITYVKSKLHHPKQQISVKQAII